MPIFFAVVLLVVNFAFGQTELPGQPTVTPTIRGGTLPPEITPTPPPAPVRPERPVPKRTRKPSPQKSGTTSPSTPGTPTPIPAPRTDTGTQGGTTGTTGTNP